MRPVQIFIPVFLSLGCNVGVLKLGNGAETDARFTADVYTWDCGIETESDETWMGAFGFDVSLVYTPDNLASRELPPVGTCVLGISMFSLDSLEGGTDIPEADEPKWVTESGQGRLSRELAGLYYDNVFKNVFSCNPVDTVVASGVELTEAARLTGISTPAAGTLMDVSVGGSTVGGIAFGEPIDLSWDVDGWDESFIQIRRTRSNILVESLTCNTTGSSEFTMDSVVWDQLNSDLSADRNYLYVGFRNIDDTMSPDGQRAETETRALHVVGLTNL